jgi:hypothetical protein
MRRRFTFAAFALAPMIALLLAAEAAVRVRYFFQNGRDWSYLTTPIGKFRRATDDPPPRGVEPDRAKPERVGGIQTVSAIGRAPGQQIIFTWPKPCEDRMVYSVALGRAMPRTWDENCFRGDRLRHDKQPGEYRIFFVGGSTVEDAQSDEEMMTTWFKRALRLDVPGPVAVVNAGRAGFDSRDILAQYDSTIAPFSPDLVLYFEAWNEQPKNASGTRSWFSRWLRADAKLGELPRWRIHRALYYRSLLYTYLVEKYEFAASSRRESAFWRDAHFWKIDRAALRAHFTDFVDHVRRNGGRPVFVTQVVNFPRAWKSTDTFDYGAVDALLDRLRADTHYAYDVQEISALNQRLAVDYTIALCRELSVPVVDIRNAVEALGDRARAEMFLDLGHRTIKGNEIVGELIARDLARRYD